VTACPPKIIDKLHSFKGRPSNPSSLIFFEDTIDQLGDIITMEVVGCKRDGQNIHDITFYSFHHEVRGRQTYIKFQYSDFANIVADHIYGLDVMFHIVISLPLKS
jgi:hypothetical protein